MICPNYKNNEVKEQFNEIIESLEGKKTTKVETKTGKDYTVSIPAANNVAGVMVHHEKENAAKGVT